LDTEILNFDPPVLIIPLTLHCLIGLVAAQIAARKGRRRGRWIALGLVVGTPAFIAALLLPPWENK
jgi:hypothetical protein